MICKTGLEKGISSLLGEETFYKYDKKNSLIKIVEHPTLGIDSSNKDDVAIRVSEMLNSKLNQIFPQLGDIAYPSKFSSSSYGTIQISPTFKQYKYLNSEGKNIDAHIEDLRVEKMEKDFLKRVFKDWKIDKDGNLIEKRSDIIKKIVQDLSGNTYSVNESEIITYETDVGPIRYIIDENGDMVMLSDKNTLEQNPNSNIEPNFDASNKSDNNKSRITYDQLENLWGKEGFEIGKEYSHKEFIEFIEKNGSPEALAVWKLIKDKLDQFPAAIMILHQTDPRFESVMNEAKSILKGKPFAGVYRKNQIILNSSLLSVSSERAVKTTVHELIHAVTINMLHLHEYINSDRFLKAQKSIQDKWGKVYDTFSTEQKNTLREMFELFEEIQKSKLLEGHYGMTNIREFFAELANPEFIKELKKLEVIKSPKEKSFFERIVELIYKLFGKDVSYEADRYILDSLSILLEGDVDYNKYITAEPLFDSLEQSFPIPQQTQEINELFESNPELANEVYEALGFDIPNLPIIDTENIISFEGTKGAAQYDRRNNQIKVNRKFLKQKFLEKAWTKPRKLIEFLNGEQVESYAQALPENQFTTYQEWEQFVINHEYQHSLYSRQDFDKEFPNKTKGDYESEINRRALNQITPQQKQQAQQLYAQYLEQNPNGSVEGFKKFVEDSQISTQYQSLQERSQEGFAVSEETTMGSTSIMSRALNYIDQNIPEVYEIIGENFGFDWNEVQSQLEGMHQINLSRRRIIDFLSQRVANAENPEQKLQEIIQDRDTLLKDLSDINNFLSLRNVETKIESFETILNQFDSLPEGTLTTQDRNILLDQAYKFKEPMLIFKGLDGKRNDSGDPIIVHNVRNVTWGSQNFKDAETYAKFTGKIGMFLVEGKNVVDVKAPGNTPMSMLREVESQLIENSYSDVIRLDTVDGTTTDPHIILKGDRKMIGLIDPEKGNKIMIEDGLEKVVTTKEGAITNFMPENANFEENQITKIRLNCR